MPIGGATAVRSWLGSTLRVRHALPPAPPPIMPVLPFSLLLPDNGLVLGGHADRAHSKPIVAAVAAHAVIDRTEVEVPRVVRVVRVERT